MRKATTLLTILASFVFYAFALSTPASADPNSPGNNGTVKIHDANTSVEDMRNEPHVCRFYVDGFKFDNNSSGQWWIESWPPTGNRSEVRREAWTANGQGDWHSGLQTLPDGHYKLYAKQQNEATPGGNKQKVFWVECAVTPAASASGTPAPTATPSPVVGGTTTTTTGGTTTTTGGSAVLGFQSAPAGNGIVSVSPIVEVPGGSNQQSPNIPATNLPAGTVAGVQSLPSTSTDGTPALPLAAMGLAIMALGGAFLRRRDPQR